METEPITILIVEDDDGHAELIKKGLKKNGLLNETVRFTNGKEAWDFISDKVKERGKEKLSYLMLLDINMPVMDGIELLRLMKGNDITKVIPVAMLTTTDDEREIKRCYELGCNVYIKKPVEYTDFLEVLKRLGLFVQIVKLP